MKIRAGIVAMAAAATLALSACGGGQQSPTQDQGPADSGELRFAMWNQAQSEVMKTIVADFNKTNPNIKVNVEVTPFDNYWTKLQTEASSGNQPDVFWMNGPNFQLYASNGQLEPLDDVIDGNKIDPANYPESLNKLYSYEDKQYGVPKDFDTVGLWYNKKIFDQAGETYPADNWTWEDYKSTAKRISDKLKDQGIYGTAIRAGDAQMTYYNSIPQAGGFVISEDQKKSGYDDPNTIKGLKLFADLMADGSAPTAQQLTDTRGDKWFASGRAAMIWGASFEAPVFSAIKDDIQVVPLPRDSKQATVIHGLAHVISANSKSKAAAKTFLAYLGSKEASETWSKSGTVIPSFKGSQDAYLASNPQWNLQVFLDAAENYAVPYPVSKNTAEWNKLEKDILSGVWTGQKTAEEAGKELAAKMNETLAKE
ncbi:sugar ABC transporter substrate-binding protein [Arthrobacter sp. D1-29]